jgi:hypothetical protein
MHRPVVAPIVAVERETWEALVHTTNLEDLGCGLKIAKASKVVKMVGFPPDLLSS